VSTSLETADLELEIQRPSPRLPADIGSAIAGPTRHILSIGWAWPVHPPINNQAAANFRLLGRSTNRTAVHSRCQLACGSPKLNGHVLLGPRAPRLSAIRLRRVPRCRRRKPRAELRKQENVRQHTPRHSGPRAGPRGHPLHRQSGHVGHPAAGPRKRPRQPCRLGQRGRRLLRQCQPTEAIEARRGTTQTFPVTGAPSGLRGRAKP